MVKLLIDAGANVNASSPIIGSPLHVVTSENIPNRLEILSVLLERGADPNTIVISDDGMPLKPPLGEYISSNTDIDPNVIKLLMRYGAKVILKSQFRDPLGILNCLSNVTKDEKLLMEILGTAEDFDPPIIRRCTALTPAQKDYVLSLSRNPKSLKHQSRLFLRKYLGKKLPHRIGELELPKILVHYLLFEIS